MTKFKAVHAMAHPAHFEKPTAAAAAPATVDDAAARADLLAALDDEGDAEGKED